MFMSKEERLSPEDKMQLISDAPKMRAMINQVALFIADVLCLKDADIAGNLPLVEVCRQEIHHVLWVHGLARRMDALSRTYKFVCQAEDCAERLRDCSKLAYGENIDLGDFTSEDPYYLDVVVIKTLNGNRSRVSVGAYGEQIMKDVYRHSLEWLDKLDKVMCLAVSLDRTERVTEALEPVKMRLARAIAMRIAVMSKESVLDDELSSRALEDMVKEEYERCEPHASSEMHADIKGLEILKKIATDPTGNESRHLLSDFASSVNHVLKNCPCEISAYEQDMGFEKLGRALVPNMDNEVRLEIAKFWSDNYGRDVVCIIDHALPQMKQWQPSTAATTIASFRSSATGRPSPVLAIPSMSFLHSPKRFARHNVSVKRSGLDERGIRAVRMIRCVWEMASQGTISSGIVASEIVAAVGTEGVVVGRMAAEMINSERDMSKQGVRLSKFFAAIHDQEGDHKEAIAKAACHLSSFSCAELETVFRTDSNVLRAVCSELALLTKSNMLVHVDPEYKSFASEALAYALPIIERRREGLGINRFLRPRSVIDLLLTLPRARTWRPTDGTLSLCLNDVRHGHCRTREIFDRMHDAGVLVQRKGGGKTKVVYQLDTALLVELFNNCARI